MSTAVELTEIKVVEKPDGLAGVPWREAPCGPARVVVGAPNIGAPAEGEVVVITRARNDAGDRDLRMLCCGGWPWIFNPANDVRVQPLGPCKVELDFA